MRMTAFFFISLSLMFSSVSQPLSEVHNRSNDPGFEYSGRLSAVYLSCSGGDSVNPAIENHLNAKQILVGVDLEDYLRGFQNQQFKAENSDYCFNKNFNRDYALFLEQLNKYVERRAFEVKLFSETPEALEKPVMGLNTPDDFICNLATRDTMQGKMWTPFEDYWGYVRLAKKRGLHCEVMGAFPTGKLFALLIGVEEYQNLPNLFTPIRDVQAVGEILARKFGYEVELLKNPTRKDITKKLNQFEKSLRRGDLFLIYYAGHGVSKNGDGYWQPVNASVSDDSDWISNDYLTKKFKSFKATNILVISDSCYSGTLSRGLAVKTDNQPLDAIDKFMITPSRVVITSGGLEPVFDGGGGAHSIFARALLSTLVEIDGPVTATKVYTKILDPVVNDSLRLGRSQTPTISNLNHAGHIGPDFVFLPK